MSKQPDQKPRRESQGPFSERVGAAEVLTQNLARRISRMIEQLPDVNIAVTWDNVMVQTKLRFGHQFSRNVLSQKSWNGRKLISEAFRDAKEVQRRQARDTAPKYANEPRSRLLIIVAKTHSEILALREKLDRIRGIQYDEIYSLLSTGTPFDRLVELKCKGTSRNRVGAKEVLTQDLAGKIVRMIEQFPGANIAVTWDNVIDQTRLRFGYHFRRNVLSQKSWDNRKLIAEAFQDAKEVQRWQSRGITFRYAKEPRLRLRLIIAKNQFEILALHEQLGRVRAAQYDAIHSLLDTQTPLNRLVKSRFELCSTRVNEPERTVNSNQARS